MEQLKQSVENRALHIEHAGLNSAAEIPSNRQIFVVMCELQLPHFQSHSKNLYYKRGKNMDKPRPNLIKKPMQDTAQAAVKHGHQNVFAVASYSVMRAKQVAEQQMKAFFGFGFTMKTRYMRIVGVTYKPNGTRECQRRLKQLAKAAEKNPKKSS